MSIHERIRKRREELGLSLEQVASELGISWQAVQHWERNKAPKRLRLEQAAQALHTTVEYLLFGSGEPDGSDAFSAKALEVARLYDALPPQKQRLLFAQAQVLHNPDEPLNLGDAEPPVEPPRPALPSGRRTRAS